MRRVLLISPHFPPDSSAGTHRVRLLAPYLERFGWEPTVLTVEPDAYEGTLDPDLLAMVPASLRVVRASALPARVTRRFGVGDLGLRSFPGLYRAACRLLGAEPFDALFITIFPAYTALLGPLLVRRFRLPFVLDYQDPWVGAWGVQVGGGVEGRPDVKSRISRYLAECMEPRAVRAASAITAVSSGTYEPILERNPNIRPATAAIPIGAESGDFACARSVAETTHFDAADGRIHVCYTGTILPLGGETLTAVLHAVALVRDRRPDLYGRLRLHFFGTSNQTVETSALRVMPVADRLGVADAIVEVPTRVPYSEAVRIQRQATILLAMGSSERHYTASKVFPLLLARRPLLAVYHEASSVTDILGRVSRPPSVRVVSYSDRDPAPTKIEAIFTQLTALADSPVWTAADLDMAALGEYSAEALAGRLAGVFDQVAAPRAA
jgi:glycosyltransferase involved in cell wall biosynthesis